MRRGTGTFIRIPPRHESSERGAIAVLAALLIVAFLAAASLVVDFGMILIGRKPNFRLPWTRGPWPPLKKLPNQTSARQFAVDYVGLDVKGKPAPEPDVSFPASNVVRVSASVSLPAFFATVVGLRSFADAGSRGGDALRSESCDHYRSLRQHVSGQSIQSGAIARR